MLIFYKSIKVGDRPFGIELEMGEEVPRKDVGKIVESVTHRNVQVTDWQPTQKNNYWNVKVDGSCGTKGHLEHHYGVEVCSPKMRTVDDLAEVLDISSELSGHDCKVNNNCGYHIHLEVSDFAPHNVAILVAYWLKIENIIKQIVPEHRRNNKHCKFWGDYKKFSFANDYYQVDDFMSRIWPDNFSPHDNPQRRVALNIINYAAFHSNGDGKNTVELRIPEGTLHKENIKNWFYLFYSLVNTCKSETMPVNVSPVNLDEFFKILGLEGSHGFYVLDNELRRLKLWILSRILQFSDDPNLITVASERIKKIMNHE